jgi:hypothetical protein
MLSVKIEPSRKFRSEASAVLARRHKMMSVRVVFIGVNREYDVVDPESRPKGDEVSLTM